jgi:hypothetical protein
VKAQAIGYGDFLKRIAALSKKAGDSQEQGAPEESKRSPAWHALYDSLQKDAVNFYAADANEVGKLQCGQAQRSLEFRCFRISTKNATAKLFITH